MSQAAPQSLQFGDDATLRVSILSLFNRYSTIPSGTQSVVGLEGRWYPQCYAPVV